MRTVHICEKCGKEFFHVADAFECEESHKGFGFEFDVELEKRYKWGELDVLPEVAVLASTPIRMCSTANEVPKEGEEGFAFGLYELRRYLTPAEVKKIYAEHDERIEKDRAAFEAYVRQEAENARIIREVAEENERSNEE